MAVDEARNETRSAELGNTGYEIFVGALSVLSLVNLVLIYAFRDDTALHNVVFFMNALLSFIFLADFLDRLHRAPNRSAYFFRQYGWADLLASLPFPQVKILRTFRLIRVARLLRRFGVRGIFRSLLTDRAGSALLTLLLVGMLVLEFGSLLMLQLESGAANANITTASDALWYSIATMSTVGYGDVFPVTNSGRELGAFIIVVGVGIFGTLTGYLANLFLAPKRRQAAAATPDSAVADARRRLDEVQALLAQQQSAVTELEAALAAAD